MQSNIERTGSSSQGPSLTLIFKLIVVGDSGVGKSTFIEKFSQEILEERETNAQKVKVHKAVFPTTLGDIQFNILDLDVAKIETELPKEFLKDVNCAIIMFDVSNIESYENCKAWFTKIQESDDEGAEANMPMVLTGNKVDIKERLVKPKMIVFHREKNMQYYDISAQQDYSIQKPFIYIIRKLVGDPQLDLVQKE